MNIQAEVRADGSVELIVDGSGYVARDAVDAGNILGFLIGGGVV